MVESIEKKEKTEQDFPQEVQSCLKGKTFEKLVLSKENAFLSKKLATLELNVPTDSFMENISDLTPFVFHPETIINPQVKEFFISLEFFSLVGEEQKKLQSWEDL